MQALRPITTMLLFENEVIAAGEDAETVAIDLREIASAWKFSVHIDTSGIGTYTLEVLSSCDGELFHDAEDDLQAGASTGSTYFFSMDLALAPFIKFKVSATAQPLTVDILQINIQ